LYSAGSNDIIEHMIDTLAAGLAADLAADLAPDRAPDRAADLAEELRWTGRPDCEEPDWDEFDLSMDQWLNRSIDDFCRQLAAAPTARMGRDQIDRIAALERLRAVTAAAQTVEEVAFAKQQRAEQVAAGVSARNLGRGIAEQIGFARRISPAAAAFHLGTAAALTQRLPAALAQLRRGAISEAQCQILATKTSHLTAADAAIVDAATAERMDGWNLRQTEQGVQHAAYAIDPRGFVDRRGRAKADRRVWTRPAPDCMAIVSALLPAAQGVAVYAHLNAAARTARGQGDARTLGQLMADTLVERTTGQSAAHLVPIEVNLTITEDSLFDNGDTPAWLQDYGPLPAEHARAVIAGEPPEPPQSAARQDELPALPTATSAEWKRSSAWIRRILTDPITGVATNIDSRHREFDGLARQFITLRDRSCRQPYCTAPIRHADHLVPVRRSGPTSIDNGQGLCERGNYAKDMPGWHTSTGNRPGEVITTTPTGHSYRTQPPPQVGLPARTIRE